MPPVPPRRRRARPVADAPIDSLLSRTEELTKGWLLTLLEQAPLEQAAAIVGAEVAQEGPRVCGAAVRALASDVDLRRLEPGGALRPLAARVGELAGAATAADTARVVDALVAVVWAALREELRRPDPDLVSELSERLTLVGEVLRTAGLERGAGAARIQPAARSAAGPLHDAPGQGPGAAAGPFSPPSSPAGAPPLAVVPPAAVPPAAVPPAAMPPGAVPPSSAVPPVDGERPAVWPDDAGHGHGLGHGHGRIGAAEPLWVEALEEEIRRSVGSPLSLLVVEFEDAERVVAAQTPSRARETLDGFAAAVRSVMRHQDILVCESDSRAWVIATGTGRGGARALGERIAEAVRRVDSWHGVPLSASVGVAVLGEDGRTAAELIDAAEEGRFAAAASGVRVFRGDGEPPETG